MYSKFESSCKLLKHSWLTKLLASYKWCGAKSPKTNSGWARDRLSLVVRAVACRLRGTGFDSRYLLILKLKAEGKNIWLGFHGLGLSRSRTFHVRTFFKAPWNAFESGFSWIAASGTRNKTWDHVEWLSFGFLEVFLRKLETHNFLLHAMFETVNVANIVNFFKE